MIFLPNGVFPTTRRTLMTFCLKRIVKFALPKLVEICHGTAVVRHAGKLAKSARDANINKLKSKFIPPGYVGGVRERSSFTMHRYILMTVWRHEWGARGHT